MNRLTVPLKNAALTLAMVVWMCGPAQSETPTPREIRLMVLREVNSSTAKPGDMVKLRVDEAFLMGGREIAVGTPAFGQVESAKDAGMALQRGRLTVVLSHLLMDGEQVPLNGTLADQGGGGSNDDVAKALLAPMYLLFARGNVAKLRAGQIVYGRLASDSDGLLPGKAGPEVDATP